MTTTDRTGWTPLQIAWADHAATESAVYELVNDLEDAEANLARREEDIRLDWTDLTTDQDVANTRQRRDVLAAKLEIARKAERSAWGAYDAVRRLTRKQFADELGIAPDTLSGYVSRGQAPAPDGRDDEHGHPWWYGSTVTAYVARAKRPGARRDLKQRS